MEPPCTPYGRFSDAHTYTPVRTGSVKFEEKQELAIQLWPVICGNVDFAQSRKKLLIDAHSGVSGAELKKPPPNRLLDE